MANFIWIPSPLKGLEFTYTGEFEKVESYHPQNGAYRFYLRLLTSGELTFLKRASYDLFAVGGGGGGGGTPDSYTGGGGGGGGYTINKFGAVSRKNIPISVSIGAGGARRNNGEPTIFQDFMASPGLFGPNGIGGAGGSGGGGGGYTPSNASGFNGGSDGADGMYRGGSGQGSSTKPFSGDVSPFSNMLFSGGGGGGTYTNLSAAGPGYGGLGGGGRGAYGEAHDVTNGQNGEINTGGGGGGNRGGGNNGPSGQPGAGGSGIVILRLGDWTA